MIDAAMFIIAWINTSCIRTLGEMNYQGLYLLKAKTFIYK